MLTTWIRRHAGTAVAATLLVLVTACGGDDDPTPTGEGPEAGEEASDEASSASENAEDGTGGGDAQAAAAECPEGAPLPDDTDRHGALTVGASTVEMEAGDQFFDPTCLTDVSQGTVTLTIENTGQALHNIKIEEQGIDEDIDSGETVTVDVEVGDEPVAFTCKYHSTLGMHGAIVPES